MTTFGADPVGFLWKEYDAAIAAGDTATAEHVLGNINEWCGLPRDWRSLREREPEWWAESVKRAEKKREADQ